MDDLGLRRKLGIPRGFRTSLHCPGMPGTLAMRTAVLTGVLLDGLLPVVQPARTGINISFS